MPPRKRPLPRRANSELVALLGACRAQPDEDTPRLVLADWLDERGDAVHAELVRVQCRMARDQWSPERQVNRQRESELILIAQESWLAPFQREGWYFQLDRGLIRLNVHGTRASVKALLALVPTEAWEWIGHLSLYRVTARALDDLAESSVLPVIRALSAGETGADEVARRIAATSGLTGLQRLEMGFSFTSNGAAALADAEHLAEVTELDLRNSKIDARGLRLLFDSPGFVGVQTLNLYSCKIGPGAARVMAESDGMPDLRSVTLSKNELGTEGAVAIANCDREGLCELELL